MKGITARIPRMRAGVLAIVAGFLLTGAATAEVTTVIHAGTLIADPGQPPLHDQSIVIVDGRVRSVERGDSSRFPVRRRSISGRPTSCRA